MNRPSWLKVVTDVVLFVVGIMIVLHELGMPPYGDLPRPMSVVALVFGGLLCNGPIIIQALTAWRGGTPTPTSSPGAELPGSSSEPSPEPSSGGS